MIIKGNCVERMAELPASSVDLCITSPPYKDSDGYTEELMTGAFREIYRLLKPDTLFFLNFGHLAADKFRPFRTCELAMNVGFKLNDTIVWKKNHYKPIQGQRRLNNLTEFIFLLYKGEMPILNRLGIGVPYADISNAKRFAGGRNLKCRGNLWEIDYPTINSSEDKPHPDMFPPELPENCIKLCGYPVQVVLDPFSGSGTTCFVAKALKKDYIGIEKNPETFRELEELVEPESVPV
jgi:DNA modification methylase